MNVSVSDKIEALLQRVAGVKRGSECPRPVKFNAAGERHANAVAARDAAVHLRHEPTTETPKI